MVNIYKNNLLSQRYPKESLSPDLLPAASVITVTTRGLHLTSNINIRDAR